MSRGPYRTGIGVASTAASGPATDGGAFAMANLITSSRFVLLFLIVMLAYLPFPHLQLLNLPLVVLMFASDGLDGYVARKRGEESLFGSLFDIAVDRVVENVLWIVLADLDLVPIWVPLVFIIRGAIVDSLRAYGASEGQTPFGMMHTAWGQFLVAGRFMRVFYAVVKAVAFGWILLFQPVQALYSAWWESWGTLVEMLSLVWVHLAVALCLLRGLPVVADFLSEAKRNGDLFGQPR